MQISLAFLVGAPGGEELLLICVVVLLMFGPKKLPEVARQIGKTMEYLRRTSQEFREQVMRLDEELPKVVDSALKDNSTPADTVSPPSITPGIDPYFPNHDPYNIYGENSMSESGNVDVTPADPAAVTSSAAEPVVETVTTGEMASAVATTAAITETDVQQHSEQHNANTEKLTGGIPEIVPGSKSPDDISPKSIPAG